MRLFARLRAARTGVVAALLAGLAALTAAPAAAQPASPWIDYGQGRARLVSAGAGVADDGRILLGLHYDMAPGWEVYWRSPGEAGVPTEIDWSASDNIAGASIAWPVPHRFEIFDIETFGYRDEVVLPIAARAPRPGEDVAVRAAVSFLTCKEICVPHTLEMTLDLPAAGPGGTAISEHAALIDRYRARVPRRDTGLGLSVERAEVVGLGGERVLQVVARSSTPMTGPDVYVEGPPVFTFARPDVRLSAGGRRAVLQLPVSYAALDGETPRLAGEDLTLTLVDGPRAVEQTLTATLGRAEGGASLPLLAILALALVGGLVLNVMPCVLPVLSIKLMSVLGHGGGERRAIRRGFLATAAGIVAAFLALSLALAGLKAGGRAVGWGMQFQEPLFVVAMALVVTLFAANLWGLFEVRLPARLAGFAGRPSGDRRGLAGAFASGVLATILATPCSAPFLGTAVGFALARGPAEIVAIFAALGLGMAAPFLLVAAAPAVVARLPAPGPWMRTVRVLLGVALAGTGVWLLSVLASQIGGAAAYALGALLAASLALLWARRRLPGALQRAAAASVVVLAALAFAIPQLAGGVVRSAIVADDSIWQPFEPAAIPRLVAEGKTVFVDVTADWCITCQVNKTLVLDRSRTQEVLRRDDVVAMRADWTNPDPAIARYLASFDRFGIPFSAVYGPIAPHGLVLPELLKEEAVLDAVERAAGPRFLSGRP